MKTQIKKYAGFALASTVVIAGIASAAITPIPTISNTFAIAGQKILSADINKLAEALNILDARTNGTTPTEPNHLADKEYVDSLVPKWVDVPLTDTADFDTYCRYRFTLSNGNMIEAGSVRSKELTSQTIDVNSGNVDTHFVVVLSTAKNNTKVQASNFNNVALYPDIAISSMVKKCD